ncbi:choline/carnitine O-acyltransferase, partial [Lactiplantibacillus plantarum]|uniref:choline/carnitine O-acyltransferase n=1 Tax=Lactiplantibacillus plantarum TaxID=1590 RepID=UPI003EC905C5
IAQCSSTGFHRGIVGPFLVFFQYLTLPSASQLMVLNTIPMCSSQYERMFNTSRVPGVEEGIAACFVRRDFTNNAK